MASLANFRKTGGSFAVAAFAVWAASCGEPRSHADLSGGDGWPLPHAAEQVVCHQDERLPCHPHRADRSGGDARFELRRQFGNPVQRNLAQTLQSRSDHEGRQDQIAGIGVGLPFGIL